MPVLAQFGLLRISQPRAHLVPGQVVIQGQLFRLLLQLYLAGGDHCQIPMRLLDGKIVDPVAEEILVFGSVHRLRVYLESMGQTLLTGKIARPQMRKIVALGDRAGIKILRPVHHPVFHRVSSSPFSN